MKLPVGFVLSVSCFALYWVIFAVFMILLSKAKKRLSEKNVPVPKKRAHLVPSMCCCMAVILLPFAVPLGIFVSAVVSACALFGEEISLKERYDDLTKLL